MKLIRYYLVGLVFGVVLTKSEAVSWFRIYEMFRFGSFHMYGIIGSAVVVGILAIWFIKKYKLSEVEMPMALIPKKRRFVAPAAGGIIFGCGWALTGACPGPLFILLGNGYAIALVVILSAMMGTFVYGLLRPRLPH